MKTQKKIIALVLTFLLVFATVGCSKNNEPAPAAQNDVPDVQNMEDNKEGEKTVDFPKGPIRMIITHGVGGSVDVAARGMAVYLEKYIGTNVITENMEGAGGRKAMEFVFASDPDGQTIVVSAFPSRLIGELVYPDSKYKMKDFVHLGSWLGGDYRSIMVSKDSPYQSFEELLAASKERPLTAAGGGGLGSTSQLQTVFLREKIGLNAEFIPFESTAEVASSVIGNHVDFGIMPVSSSMRFAEQGEVNIIGVHSLERLPGIEDVPTLEELGYPGVVIPYGVGAWAPPGTSKEIQDLYAEAMAKAVADPEFLKWAEQSQIMLEPLGHKEFLETTLADYDSINSVLDLLLEAQ